MIRFVVWLPVSILPSFRLVRRLLAKGTGRMWNWTTLNVGRDVQLNHSPVCLPSSISTLIPTSFPPRLHPQTEEVQNSFSLHTSIFVCFEITNLHFVLLLMYTLFMIVNIFSGAHNNKLSTVLVPFS